MNSARGFLISYLKFGDNDAVLHFFTQESGYETFFLRGLYAAKNKKKAYLHPLKELNLALSQSTKNSSLKSISKLESIDNDDYDSDIRINSIVFFISDFLNQVLRNESQNTFLYEKISNLVIELKKKNYQSHLIFMVNFLNIHGLGPLSGDGIFLDPESGTFSQNQSHHLFDEEISQIWNMILRSENPYIVKIKNSLRKNFLDSLLVYYHYHFSDFKQPKSLEIVQQIFE